MLDQLHIGVEVYGDDGKKLGTLKRIVVARDDLRVTQLVVDPGLLESGNLFSPGGWEKPRERVLPVSLVTSASNERVSLSCDEAAFRQLPLFERESFGDVPAAEGRFRLGDLVSYVASAAGVGAAPYEPADEQITFNEAAGAAEIAEDTPVWRRVPHEEIGAVVRALLDESTGRLRALIVRRRGLARHTVILPMTAVTDLTDGVVHVALTDEELDALAPYTPPHE